MKHISTIASSCIKKGAGTGCGECPGFLPERLQDLLHGGQPILPEQG